MFPSFFFIFTASGLLNSDLLPIDFRKLIALSKHNNLNDREEGPDKQMEDLITCINNIDEMGCRAKAPSPGFPSIMSQAHLLLTPLEGDIFTEDAIFDDPYIVESSSNNICMETQMEDSADDEPLPPGIVQSSPTTSFSRLKISSFTNEEPEVGLDSAYRFYFRLKISTLDCLLEVWLLTTGVLCNDIVAFICNLFRQRRRPIQYSLQQVSQNSTKIEIDRSLTTKNAFASRARLTLDKNVCCRHMTFFILISASNWKRSNRSAGVSCRNNG